MDLGGHGIIPLRMSVISEAVLRTHRPWVTFGIRVSRIYISDILSGEWVLGHCHYCKLVGVPDDYN